MNLTKFDILLIIASIGCILYGICDMMRSAVAEAKANTTPGGTEMPLYRIKK